MADGSIAITAGSGTAVDTRTEGTNGNHRQVVVLGDPSTNAGVAPVDATAGLKVDLGADNDVTVTGTVTANLSSTDNTVLDSIDTSTQGILADTAAIQTAVETIDDVVKAEDAAHQSGDKGVMALAVRQDSQSDFGADGDYVPLSVNDAGQLRVEATVEASVDTTGLATDTKQDEQTTALEAIQAAVEGTLTVTGGGGGTEYTEGDTDASITGSAIMWEDGSDTLRAVSAAKPLPVDLQDTTVAVTQSGTWDEVGINDSGNSITVDNGGTFATQVDGAALTALQLIDDVVKTDDAGFTPATDKVAMVGAQVDNTGTDSVDEGDAGALRMSANRNLYVNIRDNAGNERGLNIDSNGYLTSNINGTVTVGSHAVTNAGTFVTQENGAALTALQLIDDVVYTDDTSTHSTGSSKGALFMAAATPTDSSVNANDIGAVAMTTDRKLHVAVMDALPAGSAAIGKLAANSGVDIGDVDVTSISAGTNSIGNVGLIGRTTGGMSIFRSLDIDESEEEVKGSAGQVFSITCFNKTAAPLYLKFYNATAANVTVGSTTPVLTFLVPGNADSDGAGFVWNNDIGFAFGTAISVAATTGIADADTGAPGANDCLVIVGYV